MNITQITFSGTTRNNSATNGRRNSYNQGKSYDSFESSSRTSKTSNHRRKKKNSSKIPSFIAGVGLATLIALSSNAKTTQKVQTIVPTNNTELEQIAAVYDCDTDFLSYYNKLDENTDLSTVDEIKVPYTYDYLNDEIDKVEQKLQSKNLSNEKQFNLKSQLKALEAKKEEQDSVAKVYADEKYVYFYIDFDENASDEIKEKYQYGINVEKLKDLFDIKDNVIKNYNDLKVKWVANSEGGGGYYDYTSNWFHNGDVVKVPQSAINTKDIDLNGYE